MRNQPPEDAELADAIDLLKYKDAITVTDVLTTATGCLAEWLNDRRNRRAIPHRMPSPRSAPIAEIGDISDPLSALFEPIPLPEYHIEFQRYAGVGKWAESKITDFTT